MTDTLVRYVTRHNNDELYEMMNSLLPIEVEKIQGFDDWVGAVKYLEHILESETKLVVNIDLDCFIFDWSVVEELIKDMNDCNLGYTHCGASDASMKGRANSSWVVMNPFFNVFDIGSIPTINFEEAYHEGYRSEWSKSRCSYLPEPIEMVAYEQPFTEPFNGLFNTLFLYGNPLFLKTREHEDGISTVLMYKDKEFALHSWYSREFNFDEFHRERILKLYQEALDKKNK